MSVHYVPPRDPNEIRLEQIKTVITETLQSHIAGRGRETKINKAAEDIITALRPLLKLSPKPDKGATVMTEAAAAKNEAGKFTKGPSNL